MVTHSSDVTSESKIDTNAGTTAASGFGYSVLGEGKPSVLNAVVGERGSIRTCAEARAVLDVKAFIRMSH